MRVAQTRQKEKMGTRRKREAQNSALEIKIKISSYPNRENRQNVPSISENF